MLENGDDGGRQELWYRRTVDEERKMQRGGKKKETIIFGNSSPKFLRVEVAISSFSFQPFEKLFWAFFLNCFYFLKTTCLAKKSFLFFRIPVRN